MKRHWGTDELVEHWTLLPRETELLTNKTGATRLGFAVLLKFFQLEAYFRNKHRPYLRWRWNLSQSRSIGPFIGKYQLPANLIRKPLMAKWLNLK